VTPTRKEERRPQPAADLRRLRCLQRSWSSSATITSARNVKKL
jgi:hypothetical protein